MIKSKFNINYYEIMTAAEFYCKRLLKAKLENALYWNVTLQTII